METHAAEQTTVNNTSSTEPAVELMSTDHPWGGIDASSYQEWLASLQQQYQALGKV